MKGKRKRAKAAKPIQKKPKPPARPIIQSKLPDKAIVPLPPEHRKSWFQAKWFVGACVAAFGVLGSCATLYQLAPRIAITPSGLLAPANSFSTQFEVINNGYLDAKDLKISCVVNKAQMSSFISQMHDVTIVAPSTSMARLKSGEKAALPLNRFMEFGPVPSVADITWNGSYKIRVLTFIGNMKFSQRFTSVTNYSGSIQWNCPSFKLGHYPAPRRSNKGLF